MHAEAKTVVDARQLRTVVGASLIGTTIEWFDFFIYGVASALVFNRLFFPSFEPLTGTLLAFSTYALGFLARPLGGIVFGHFGDRIGRKMLLMISLLVMGLSTTAIGLLPTYDQIGVWAPMLLIALRLLQGFAVGGEWGGAVLIVAEVAPARTRGFWTSWPQVGAPAGNLLAAGVFAASSALLPEDDFQSWGWRIPFLMSIVLVAVGYWLRRAVAESAVFVQEAAKEGLVRFPAVEVVRRKGRALLTGGGLRFGENICYYVVATFSITYLTEIRGGDRSLVLNAVLIGSALECLSMPFFAALSDRVGRRWVYGAGALCVAAWFPIFFGLLDVGNAWSVGLAVTVAMVAHGAMYAPQGAMITELFPTRLRYSGASIAYQATSIFAGSLAPIIALSLYKLTGGTGAVAVYVIGGLLITLVAVVAARETKGADLSMVE
ncbi:MFS transporter [Sphingobium vermicomposti]|uniref:Metabolite-proton symporter n=1 Tax=Sphingobium vermicomposti TaxID=529005 RepID=A0A846M8J9_9SPHN|nr:MFS transporter [Sphingobium vermicomposti]NIJ18192.1 metabolite-proton symporter [Sphingobium vermicomposti]